MATRKRHNKTQFVIPEDVQGAAETGWTYKTNPAQARIEVKAEPPQQQMPGMENPMESGMRAMTYSLYALAEMVLFTTRMVTMPVTVASRMFRG